MAEIYREVYGAQETNPLTDAQREQTPGVNAPCVDWSDKDLAKVTRLRLLTDPGLDFWDVSYCHGILKDGTPCRVSLPFNQLKRTTRHMGHVVFQPSVAAQIIEHAKRDGVYAKGLGILDCVSKLK